MTVEEIAELIDQKIKPHFQGQLLSRGQARSIIWRDGKLPEDAPNFSPSLSYDLLSYAYSLMTMGLYLFDKEEEEEEEKLSKAREAFRHAASAIESVILNGQNSAERDFHRFVAGACYHLARHSAQAFSLLNREMKNPNFSPSEQAITFLILRKFNALERYIAEYRFDNKSSDESLIKIILDAEEARFFEGIDIALTDHFMGALGIAMLGFERGERGLLDEAIARLKKGLSCAGDFNFVPQWWVHRLALHLLDDLWSTSFHKLLPRTLSDSQATEWVNLRELFLAVLLKRKRAEIDLWPSQIKAVKRAMCWTDNIVASLPTGSGKTRIAELCILVCLASEKKRVVFVTPLRALSAQTETTLRRSFQPLGKTVSSLYGSIGVSNLDTNFMRTSDIIVATPEKLDFALRNDPDVLSDVGLVVLDEGHMIGLGDREIRYEVQIQRLLRREDAKERRIVCLSAVLPDREKSKDFTNWVSSDQPDSLISVNWQPTRLRYGKIIWKNDHAKLEFFVGDERTWVEGFLVAKKPEKGGRRKYFPSDQRELCIATAWKLVEDGHSALIYCPLLKSVVLFAEKIVELNEKYNLVSSILEKQEKIEKALAVGFEWFDENDPVLKCLKLGVAIHHGSLPLPFRREIERLLHEGALKVIISSPTLAQGLNLSATAIIFHSLYRNKPPIDNVEFSNVVGRAGRAYVDIEGLALMPLYDKKNEHIWDKIVQGKQMKEMKSGLVHLFEKLFERMCLKHNLKYEEVNEFCEYLAGNSVWECPELQNENEKTATKEKSEWERNITNLDVAVLSLLGEREYAENELENALDQVLESSLWSRCLAHEDENKIKIFNVALIERSRYIWSNTSPSQRRGYFLAGIGFDTGKRLEKHLKILIEYFVCANGAILMNDEGVAITSITDFASEVFQISPFKPKKLNENWEEILCIWLSGKKIKELSNTSQEILSFINDAFIYRLVWAMEAVKARASVDEIIVGSSNIGIKDVITKYAIAAVETGTLNMSAATLIRAGFDSRIVAIKVAKDTGATFDDIGGLRHWLESDLVKSKMNNPDWPSKESHDLWLRFVEDIAQIREGAWKKKVMKKEVFWKDGVSLDAGRPVRLYGSENDTLVLNADFTPIGQLKSPVAKEKLESGLVKAEIATEPNCLDVTYIGSGEI